MIISESMPPTKFVTTADLSSVRKARPRLAVSAGDFNWIYDTASERLRVMHLGTIAIPSDVEGLDQAIERARAFAAAGADLTFVEAPVSLPELERIAKDVGVPQVANIVFGGKTPDPGRKHLAEMGFAIVLQSCRRR